LEDKKGRIERKSKNKGSIGEEAVFLLQVKEKFMGERYSFRVKKECREGEKVDQLMLVSFGWQI
jgi:hypothetical protein